MRIMTGFALFFALLMPHIANAQTEPPKTFTVDGNVTLTSDYRFRGISQSNRKPAIQGTANLTHESGLYIGTFVSTIGSYVVDGADPEIDLYGGIRKTVGGTTIDAGMLYYVYPGTVSFKGNSFEPYVVGSHTLGIVTARLGGNFAWKQRSLQLPDGRRRAALYTYGELSAAIPSTPVTVTGHLGHAFRPTYGTFYVRYTDWSLSGSYTYKRVTVSATYVDTNRNIRSYPGDARDRNVAGGGVFASAAIAF